MAISRTSKSASEPELELELLEERYGISLADIISEGFY
jgi:hypothetical protein